jgi:hypothetical protein
VKGAETSGTAAIRPKAIVYTKIKSVLSPQYQNLRMKTYIDHALKTSQYLCNRRPDEWKVV